MPVDRPTVANAETTSNSTASSPNGGHRQQGERGSHRPGRRRSSATVSAWRWIAGRQPAAEHVHGGFAADLGQDHERQHREGGDLDAAGGARAAAADEHQHVGDRAAWRRRTRADVEAVEARGARLIAGGRRPFSSFPRASSGRACRGSPTRASRNATTADAQQDATCVDRDLGVQATSAPATAQLAAAARTARGSRARRRSTASADRQADPRVRRRTGSGCRCTARSRRC